MHPVLRLPQLVLLLILAALAGCASAPKPTVVKAMLNAHSSVNPDARNRPSPITVRIYGLKSRAVFDSADFFSLYDKDKETLGADLLDKEEFQLMPGENRSFEKQLSPETRYLGVVAAFRDLERAQWRTAVSIVPNQVSTIQIKLERNSVTIHNKE